MDNITYLFTWIWDLLGSIVINVGSHTFSLRGVFICSLFFCLVGWCFGRLMNPWERDNDD